MDKRIQFQTKYDYLAFALQPPLLVKHSLMSVQSYPSPVKPVKIFQKNNIHRRILKKSLKELPSLQTQS